MRDLIARAPRQADHVRRQVRRMARTGVAGVGRIDADRHPTMRYVPVPPQGVYYAVVGRDLTVFEVVDTRRRRDPWPAPPPSRPRPDDRDPGGR